MAEPATRVPTKPEEKAIKRVPKHGFRLRAFGPKLTDYSTIFPPNFWSRPRGVGLSRRAPLLSNWAVAPAVDLIEKENNYEMTAELPGMRKRTLRSAFRTGP